MNNSLRKPPSQGASLPTPDIKPSPTHIPSLRDLARLAKVNISTVSRSLSDDPQISAERTKEIKALAHSIGYRPRPLRRKRMQAIGLLLTTEDEAAPPNLYLQRIMWTVERAISARKLHMNVGFIPLKEKPSLLPSIVAQNRVDGVLLAGHPPADLVRDIREIGMPATAFNDTIKRVGIPCLRAQPADVTDELVLRLAAWGHRRIGLVFTLMKYPAIHDRYTAYVNALKKAGIPFDPDLVVTNASDGLRGGRDGVKTLAARGQLPSAIFFANDHLALGGMHELMRRGLSIPRDISVIGFDNDPLCNQVEPPLTSIATNDSLLGNNGVELLLEQIKSKGAAPPREVLIQQHVVWRESTGPCKV